MFVANKKSKKLTRGNSDFGFEYDLDVTTDKEFYEKIFETDSYNPKREDMIDMYEDLDRLMVNIF